MRLDDLDLQVGRRAHLLHRTARPADTDARADGVLEAEVLGEEALRVESTAGAEAVLAATARLDIDPGAEPWAVAREPDERDLEPVRRRGDVSISGWRRSFPANLTSSLSAGITKAWIIA